ncbi:MAG: peptidylprolyl isomerase [Acidimicrobiaceae bacterium]|nr:peptidylprolyl isomerase [Acidimicrobiaceae bacterium]
MNRFRLVGMVVAVLALLASACGGDTGVASAPSAEAGTPVTTEAAADGPSEADDALASTTVAAAVAEDSDGPDAAATIDAAAAVDDDDAAMLLASARAAAVLGGRSVRGEATIELAPGFEISTSFESDADGDLAVLAVLPPGVDPDFPGGADAEIRYVGGVAYLRPPVTAGELAGLDVDEAWFVAEPASAGDPMVQAAGSAGVVCVFLQTLEEVPAECDPLGDAGAFLEAASEPHIVGRDDIGGVETTRVRFTVSLLDLAAEALDVVPDGGEAETSDGGVFDDSVSDPFAEGFEQFFGFLDAEFEVEVWIDDDSLIRRLAFDLASMLASMAGGGEAAQMPSSVLTLEFYDFDADISVDAPPPDAIFDEDLLISSDDYATSEEYNPYDGTRDDTDRLGTVGSDVSATGCPAVDGSSPRTIDFDGRQPMCIDAAAGYVAVFDTSEGEMRFVLTASETPLTVNNFVMLARWGYYDDTLLFRTDPSIDIIQGGSPHTNTAADPGPGYTISDEPAFDEDPDTGQLTGPYRYQPGQLVMARSAGRDTAGAQFFVTAGPNAALLDSQGIYVVFGTTDDAGLAVAESIIGLHEPGGAMGGAPSRDVTVHSVTIEETPALPQAGAQLADPEPVEQVPAVTADAEGHPERTYKAVSSGGSHSCAIAADDTIACWGFNDAGQASAPVGTYRAVSSGGSHSCAIAADDSLVCWGDDYSAEAPAGTYRAVSSGGLFSCAIATDDSLVCWGDDVWGALDSPAGTYKAVSAGSEHSCAIATDDSLICWGADSSRLADVPGGAYRAVSAGGDHTCATAVDGGLVCWESVNGTRSRFPLVPIRLSPSGRSAVVHSQSTAPSSAGETTPGARPKRRLACTRLSRSERAIVVPSRSMTASSAGETCSCCGCSTLRPAPTRLSPSVRSTVARSRPTTQSIAGESSTGRSTHRRALTGLCPRAVPGAAP